MHRDIASFGKFQQSAEPSIPGHGEATADEGDDRACAGSPPGGCGAGSTVPSDGAAAEPNSSVRMRSGGTPCSRKADVTALINPAGPQR